MKLTSFETQEIRKVLSAPPGVQLAYVFGSVARGNAHPGSDIDIALLSKQALDSRAILDLRMAIGCITERSVDLVDLRRAGQPVLGEILRDGVRLVGDKAAHADLATRAALDCSDFFPYVQRALVARRQAWIG